MSSLILSPLVHGTQALAAPRPHSQYPAETRTGHRSESLPRYRRLLPITARLQWDANFGYCGETSLISAGLAYGQYASQWTARALASPGVDQTQESSQLLLGVNDVAAATNMKLAVTPFDSVAQRSTPEYLSWVKAMILQGFPVIIGVFTNATADPASAPGDAEYDHIVPVLGIGSTAELSPTDRRYRSTDVVVFSDNSGDGPGSIYRTRFGPFQRTRAQANLPSAPLYSLRSRPSNYALAVTGVLDPSHVTIPIRLTASVDGEGRQDGPRMPQPPAPSPMTLTAVMSVPDPQVAYTVYLYDDFAKVPSRDFNSSSAGAIRSWTISPGSGRTWTTTIDLMSDQTRIFRAVPTSAP